MHENHRNRVRTRFETEGLDGFDAHQVLEMMLFYAIARKDTNVLAHRLLERFGSFAQVMDAPIQELEKVEGMGHQSALLLNFIRSSYRYYQLSLTAKGTVLNSIEECGQYLMAKLDGKRNEEVYLLCLDGKRKLLNCLLVGEGDVCSVNVSTRKVLNLALSQNAVMVVLAHNHPGGFAIPSDEDVKVTQHLARTLRDAGVYLLDHIVVSDSDYVSMVHSGLYSLESVGIYLDRV